MRELSEKWAHRREALAVLVLRLGLAWFLLVWAINKFLAPGQYMRLWNYIHDTKIGETAPYYIGAVQVVIIVAIIIGAGRPVSYGLGLAMHMVSTSAVWSRLMDPFVIEKGFPVNRNLSITLAALGAFVALWLLRHRDHWSFDAWFAGWRKRRRETMKEPATGPEAPSELG